MERFVHRALAGLLACALGVGCGDVGDSDGGSQGTGGDGLNGSGGDGPTGGTSAVGTGGTNGGSGGMGGTTSDNGTGGDDGTFTGTCTESEQVPHNVSGSGPHDVVIETNADPGINEGTIYRPADLGPGKKYPIVVWGNGGCSRNGLSNTAAMAEIASHGYFVVADGIPDGDDLPNRPLGGGGEVLLAYIDWVIEENS